MRLGNMAKVADKSVFEWLIDGFDVKTEFDVSADRYHDHLVGMRYAKVESFIVSLTNGLPKGVRSNRHSFGARRRSADSDKANRSRMRAQSHCCAALWIELFAEKRDRHRLAD